MKHEVIHHFSVALPKPCMLVFSTTNEIPGGFMKQPFSRFASVFGSLLLALLVACPTQTPPPSVVSVVINDPGVIALNAGQSINLTAKVTFTTATSGESVTWSIVSGGGTLTNKTALGVTFTAPSLVVASITQIKATSVQDTSKSVTRDLNINAVSNGITSVVITPPANTTLSAGATLNLNAVVTGTGTFNNAVTWELLVASGKTGTLTNQTATSATYTAPSQVSNGTVTVRATSVQDTGKVADLVLNITGTGGGDTTPPKIQTTTATSSTTVTVLFNEALDSASVVAGQFKILDASSGGSIFVAVSAASLSVDGKTVTLTTAPQTPNAPYAVLVNNVAAEIKVTDVAGNQYVPGEDVNSFSASFSGFVP